VVATNFAFRLEGIILFPSRRLKGAVCNSLAPSPGLLRHPRRKSAAVPQGQQGACPSGQFAIAKAQLLLGIHGVLDARGRVLVLVGAVLTRVLMVHMGINAWAGFRGMLMQMAVRVLMGMLVGMGFFAMPMIMAMRVSMLMNMQVVMFRYFFHGSPPYPSSLLYLDFPE
jgi:hypothetical protein